MTYQDEQSSPDYGTQLDPQQLVQLLMAARAAQQVGQDTALAQNAALQKTVLAPSAVAGQPSPAVSAAAPAPSISALGPTDPFAARTGATLGSGIPAPQPSAAAPPQADPSKAAAIQRARQVQTNPRQGTGAQSTSGSTSGQAGANQPQLPLGAPPTGLPEIHKPTPLESIQGIVAGVASQKENSTDYLVAKSKGNYKAGSDKCNELVADTIEESGLPRPQVHYTSEGRLGSIKSMFSRDPDANEWANPKVKIPGWSEPRPLSEARPGDVIAQQHGSWGHAGVVVSSGGGLLTVSVNTAHKVPGLVTKNDWGFRPRGQNGEDVKRDPGPVVRHYLGN